MAPILVVAMLEKLRISNPSRPLEPPQRRASIIVPQNMPKAVRKVRVLFRARVAPISRQLSMSKSDVWRAMILFVAERFYWFYFGGFDGGGEACESA